MSWSINPPITSQTILGAKSLLDEQMSVPEPIKEYIADGIEGLIGVHGPDVLVTITGYGHLCTGKDYDVTSATVEVRKA